MAINSSAEQACLFPVLNAHSDARQRLKHREINQLPWASLIKFCEVHAIQPLSLFQTAWAFVLQAYTGSEGSVFGCQLPTENEDSLLKILKTTSLVDLKVENLSVKNSNTAVGQKHAEKESNVGESGHVHVPC